MLKTESTWHLFGRTLTRVAAYLGILATYELAYRFLDRLGRLEHTLGGALFIWIALSGCCVWLCFICGGLWRAHLGDNANEGGGQFERLWLATIFAGLVLAALMAGSIDTNVDLLRRYPDPNRLGAPGAWYYLVDHQGQPELVVKNRWNFSDRIRTAYPADLSFVGRRREIPIRRADLKATLGLTGGNVLLAGPAEQLASFYAGRSVTDVYELFGDYLASRLADYLTKLPAADRTGNKMVTIRLNGPLDGPFKGLRAETLLPLTWEVSVLEPTSHSGSPTGAPASLDLRSDDLI